MTHAKGPSFTDAWLVFVGSVLGWFGKLIGVFQGLILLCFEVQFKAISM